MDCFYPNLRARLIVGERGRECSGPSSTARDPEHRPWFQLTALERITQGAVLGVKRAQASFALIAKEHLRCAQSREIRHLEFPLGTDASEPVGARDSHQHVFASSERFTIDHDAGLA